MPCVPWQSHALGASGLPAWRRASRGCSSGRSSRLRRDRPSSPPSGARSCTAARSTDRAPVWHCAQAIFAWREPSRCVASTNNETFLPSRIMLTSGFEWHIMQFASAMPCVLVHAARLVRFVAVRRPAPGSASAPKLTAHLRVHGLDAHVALLARLRHVVAARCCCARRCAAAGCARCGSSCERRSSAGPLAVEAFAVDGLAVVSRDRVPSGILEGLHRRASRWHLLQSSRYSRRTSATRDLRAKHAIACRGSGRLRRRHLLAARFGLAVQRRRGASSLPRGTSRSPPSSASRRAGKSPPLSSAWQPSQRGRVRGAAQRGISSGPSSGTRLIVGGPGLWQSLHSE